MGFIQDSFRIPSGFLWVSLYKDSLETPLGFLGASLGFPSVFLRASLGIPLGFLWDSIGLLVSCRDDTGCDVVCAGTDGIAVEPA